MRRGYLIALAISAIGCSGHVMQPRLAQPEASPTRVAAKASAPRKVMPWARAFTRTCNGSITAPIVAPDQSVFTLCGSRFGFAAGEYRGRVALGVLALVDADRTLSASYSDEGLVLGRGDERDAATGDGFAEDARVSPDGKRVLVALRGGDRSFVGLYRLPELTRVAMADAGAENSVANAIELGFLADGTPLVLSSDGCETRDIPCEEGGTGCTQTTCTGRSLKRLAGDRFEALGPAFDGVDHMAVAAQGSRAILQRKDGSRTVVALPGGEAVAALPAVEAETDMAAAIDAAGHRVAYGAADGLVVAEEIDGRLVDLHHEAMFFPEQMAFSPDGTTLFAGDHSTTVVLREGAPLRLPHTATYSPALPSGFEMVGFEEENGNLIERRYENGEEVYSALMPEGILHRYRRSSDDAIVTVTTQDAAEYAGDRWAERVLERDFMGEPDSSRSWGEPGARSLEYVYFRREGCLPADLYVRFTEHDGVLYKIEVELAPGTASTDVQPLLGVFFDAPLGSSHDARALLEPPGRFEGPC
jgi:hypothetical protein